MQSDQSAPEEKETSLSYKDAGVDIDAGNALVDAIKFITRKTHRAEVLSELGGFGALCEIPPGYSQPVLVSATDGVGTKLKLAMELGIHNTIGIDLVAMCVNDLIVCGAEPLFFLDYFATGKLDVAMATAVVEGIGNGCEQAGCALIGGETAEMPGMYQESDYDLAGFSVGVVEKSRVITAKEVSPGDVLIGLASSGPHSNGYSLIRKVIEHSGADLSQELDGKPLGQLLLAPTRIYVKPVQELLKQVKVNAITHITGGGFPENLPRSLGPGNCAHLDRSTWQRPAVFDWLQDNGNIEESEMQRTFNCGVGMVICVPQAQSGQAMDILKASGESATIVGAVETARPGGQSVVVD